MIRSKQNLLHHAVLSLLLVMTLAAAACQRGTPTPVPTLTPTAEPTQEPTQSMTPTPQPLGSVENPLLMGFVYGTENAEAANRANTLADQLSAQTGLTIKSITGVSYETLLAGLEQGQTHIAWLPPLTYLIASQNGSAEAGLLTNHYGVYAYGTQFLANVESQFVPYFDPATNQSTADAANALRQFAGKRPCWVEQTSASGYIVPAGLLAQESIEVLPAVIAQDHTAVIRALYIKGICDFGATYGMMGDPRTASAVQTDLPDVMNRVAVIWQSPAVIPNLNVSFFTGMNQAMRQKITDAFLEIARTEEGKKLLSDAAQYEIAGIKAVTDSEYQPLREIVAASQVDLDNLLGK